MFTSPSPDSLGSLLGLWGLAQSYIRVEDCVGSCICLSRGIPFAAVVPYERPRTDSTVPGAAQPSQQTGPALCTAAWVWCWPGLTQQKGDVELTVGDNGAVAAASVLALRLVEGWTWEISQEVKLKWKRTESEVRKRSWERCMLQGNRDVGWRKQPTSTNWQPSQNCITGSRSSWRLPVMMDL